MTEKPLGNIKPDDENNVYFYEQDCYVLSNFAAFQLTWAGIVFATSEAAYHWEKFQGNPQVQLLIREANSAHAAYKVAQEMIHLRRSDWDDVKVEIMRGILMEKARQHPYVQQKLLNTGDKNLVEDSWRDAFWGWGPNQDGSNVLGKLWMDVRGVIRKELADAEAAHAAKLAAETEAAALANQPENPNA